MSDTIFPCPNPSVSGNRAGLNRIFVSLLYQSLRYGESGEDHNIPGQVIGLNMAIYSGRAETAARMNEAELRNWLRGGTTREDGRLALFDQFAEPVDKTLIKTAVASGLAEPWFASPMRPQWTVHRLTPKGRSFLADRAKSR